MALTKLPNDPLLDLPPWVGQRQATFRFQLLNGVTGQNLGDIHPIRTAKLTHDTTRTIKRQLSLPLGKADTAAINVVTDRVLVFMVFPNGSTYPLGRYMFTDASRQVFTSGRLGNMILNDEMFLVDQQITAGINGTGVGVTQVITEVLEGLPITYSLESSQFDSAESWGPGATRGQILEALSLSGGFFSPWFNNEGVFRFIRTFEPSTQVPDFDWDNSKQVLRSGIVETDNLLTAPNRFVVISNGADDPNISVTATADVPPTAPHSQANRGFVIADVQDLQLSTPTQALAVAENLAIRNTLFEQINISTAPDPRHDSYNVVRWQEDLWLELAWGMALVEGGAMSHVLRKAYS